MERAYDPKALLEALKGQGLEVAEAGAVAVIKGTFDWLKQSAQLSATPYDDLLLIVYPQVEAAALAQADKIDGQVG